MNAILYYVHDPMCSWCWAFKKIYEEIVSELPADVSINRLLGGLAADTDDYMSEEMQGYIKSHWRTIQTKVPGIKFNFDFWDKCKPRRATYSACRAVIAARNQGSEYDELMTIAIQQGYYLQARNPSEHDTLIAFAKEMNLDTELFASDLISPETELQLQHEILSYQKLGARGFPSLILDINGDRFQIQTNYTNSGEILTAIHSILFSEENLN
jgi:putative protein-disulfide isomerase